MARLGAELRARGVRVGVGELLAAHRALDVIDAARPDEARAALHAVLCSRHDDLAAFDAAWRATFGGDPLRDPMAELQGASLALPRVGDPDAPPGHDEGVPAEPAPVPAAYSAASSCCATGTSPR